MNKVFNCDCMEYMNTCKDNQFDLAIVDPPYGIDIAKWDDKIPDKKYFNEISRVSRNQIIWGGNYFNLTHTESWLCWDKTYKFNRNINLSEFELAWTSFDIKAKFIRYTYCGNFYGWKKPRAHYNKPKNIHPTQKPVALYKWLLQNYAKPGQTIFDSHVGSGSIRIACHDLGFDFIGCELDKDYWEAQEARYNKHIEQPEIFDSEDIQKSVYEEVPIF